MKFWSMKIELPGRRFIYFSWAAKGLIWWYPIANTAIVPRQRVDTFLCFDRSFVRDYGVYVYTFRFFRFQAQYSNRNRRVRSEG